MHLIHIQSSQSVANPNSVLVQGRTLDWLKFTGALQGHESFLPDVIDVGRLVGLTYPDADLDTLQMICDWTTLFFLLDDIVELIPSPALVAMHNQRILKAMQDNLEAPINGLHIALRDVALRLRDAGGNAWMDRFLIHVVDWLSGHVWEAQNRASDKVPGEREYSHMRQYTIGMYFEFVLTELCHGPIAKGIRDLGRFKKLTRQANLQISLANDILTIDKEVARGDRHNVILSIMQARILPKDTATQIAVDMHNFVVKDFSRELADCEGKRLKRYGEDLQTWMSGHLQWGLNNKRYQSQSVEVCQISYAS